MNGDLLVGSVFIALIALTVSFMVNDLWKEAGTREPVMDFIADVLTWCRTWTFRNFVLQIGMACIALGQRLMDWAQRPEVPSGAKVSVHIYRQWERRDVVVTREHNVVRVKFGSRTLPIKV